MKSTVTVAISLLLLCCISAPITGTPRVVKQPKAVQGKRPIVQGPENVAVVAGSETTVVLQCSSDVTPGPSGVRIQWTDYSTRDSGDIVSDNDQILPGHPNSARLRIINDVPTQFDLEIRNVQVSDAGTYVCEDTQSGPPYANFGQAELVVLASAPNCSTTLPDDGGILEGQIFTTECSCQYKGNLVPQMTWTGPPPFVETGSSGPTSVFSLITFQVTRAMSVQFHTCVTNFTDLGPLPPGTADNIPTYSYRYQAQQMFVYWGPINMGYRPVKPTYEVNDVVTCYADAYPDATYTWINTRTNENFLIENFTVTADFVGIDTLMRCQAQNTIKGQIYSNNIFITITVLAPTTTGITTQSTTPTTPPAEAPCDDLSGLWIATNPPAQLTLSVVPGGDIGQIVGTFKNSTDPYFVECVGTFDREQMGYVGLTMIWPFDEGITGHAGECHRCQGTEMLFLDAMWRAFSDSYECGDGGTPIPHVAYVFTRAGTLLDAQKEPQNVWKPTHISTKILGLKLK
jgi:hypothetical protein